MPLHLQRWQVVPVASYPRSDGCLEDRPRCHPQPEVLFMRVLTVGFQLCCHAEKTGKVPTTVHYSQEVGIVDYLQNSFGDGVAAATNLYFTSRNTSENV